MDGKDRVNMSNCSLAISKEEFITCDTLKASFNLLVTWNMLILNQSFPWQARQAALRSSCFVVAETDTLQFGHTHKDGTGSAFNALVRIRDGSRIYCMMPRDDMLHSIGCNCIESWKRKNDSITSLWTHAAKRSIESSLEDGATLSGDLLCLCASTTQDCFFAGGVDGRIHAWSIMLRWKILSTQLAHTMDESMSWRTLQLPSFSFRPVTMAPSNVAAFCHMMVANKVARRKDATILDANGNPLRVTAFCILQENEEAIRFVLGTASGELICFHTATIKDSMVLGKDPASSRFGLPDDPMINAICVLEPPFDESNWSLAVGHSLGLSLIAIKSDKNLAEKH